jgi:DNA-binding Lrp family transcriptional regulator
VDELDCQILRELLVGNQPRARPDRATIEAMAKRLGVHVNTIALRIRRLETHQMFLPLTLQVTPAIGMQYASVFFPLQGRSMTQMLRSRFLAIDGVSMIIEYIDGFVLLLFAPDRPSIEAAVAAAVAFVPGTTPEVETAGWETWPKMPALPLKRHDPAILGWLARDPLRSMASIAKEVGLTSRSVELRLEELRKAHGIAMMGGATGAAEGITMGHFILDLAQGPARAAAVESLMRLCQNYLYRSITPTRIFFAVYAGSTAAILEQAERVRAVPGVVTMKTRFITRSTVNPKFADYLQGALEKVRSRGTTPESTLRS